MQLAAYLKQHGIDDEAFAALIGRDRSTVWRLRNGSKPSPSLMETIAEVTKGTVLPNDFFDLPETDVA